MPKISCLFYKLCLFAFIFLFVQTGTSSAQLKNIFNRATRKLSDKGIQAIEKKTDGSGKNKETTKAPEASQPDSVANDVATSSNATSQPATVAGSPMTQIKTDTTDETYLHMLRIRERSIFKACLDYHQDFKEAGNYRVIERGTNGQPSRIRFDYVQGVYVSFSKKWSSLEKGSIDIFFKNGLPYAMLADGGAVKKKFLGLVAWTGYDSKDGIRNEFQGEDFTKEQFMLINKYFNAEKTELLKNSPSYNAVLQRHASYPKEMSMKNNIGIIYILQDAYRFQWVEDPDPPYGAATTDNLDMVYAGKISKKYLRNISDHPIIITGIDKRPVKTGYEYRDASLRIEPGQIFDYFAIYPEYPDEDTKFTLTTYVGDVGQINNLMKARELKPGVLEVNSYVNATNISVKKGDRIKLTATGEISFGAFAGKGGPGGINGFTDYSQVEGFKHGALLVKIGAGKWFEVGTAKSFVAEADGILQLIVNDGDPVNNSGTFIVTYAINK